MTTTIIESLTKHTEKVTSVVVCPRINGSWSVHVNGYRLGRFDVARHQPDMHVFRTRQAAREFAARLVQVKIVRDVCGGGDMAVPC